MGEWAVSAVSIFDDLVPSPSNFPLLSDKVRLSIHGPLCRPGQRDSFMVHHETSEALKTARGWFGYLPLGLESLGVHLSKSPTNNWSDVTGLPLPPNVPLTGLSSGPTMEAAALVPILISCAQIDYLQVQAVRIISLKGQLGTFSPRHTWNFSLPYFSSLFLEVSTVILDGLQESLNSQVPVLMEYSRCFSATGVSSHLGEEGVSVCVLFHSFTLWPHLSCAS